MGGILARSLEPVLAFYQHFIQINILSRKCLCRTFTIGIQEMALSLDQIFSTTVLNLLVPDASLDYKQLFSDLPNLRQTTIRYQKRLFVPNMLHLKKILQVAQHFAVICKPYEIFETNERNR